MSSRTAPSNRDERGAAPCGSRIERQRRAEDGLHHLQALAPDRPLVRRSSTDPIRTEHGIGVRSKHIEATGRRSRERGLQLSHTASFA